MCGSKMYVETAWDLEQYSIKNSRVKFIELADPRLTNTGLAVNELA
jgi:hypothetical protein